jgi:hypothetical protein
VNIGDKRVFMAHKIKANDETVEIERQQISRRDMRQRGRQADKYEFESSRHHRSQQSSRAPQSGDNY